MRANLPEGLVSRRRILREQSVDQRIERSRNRRQPLGEPPGRLAEDRVERRVDAPAGERVSAREQLVQQNAEREQVAAAIGRLASNLLRRHIGGRAAHDALFTRRDRDHAGLVDRVGSRQACGEAEVHDLDVAVLGEHHVGRLQVAVDDAPLVRRFERLGDLLRHAQCFRERQRPGPQPLFERLAADELHRNAGAALERRDLVDRADERVIQGGGRARLAEQLVEAVGLAARGDELERHLSVQHHVVGEADLAHAAASDDFDDLIAGLVRRVEDHGWRSRVDLIASPRGALWSGVEDRGCPEVECAPASGLVPGFGMRAARRRSPGGRPRPSSRPEVAPPLLLVF